MVGGWVPYWQASAGTSQAKKRISVLDQISPFAYEVQQNGTLKDQFKVKDEQWTDLAVLCRQQNKLLIPTLSWHSTVQMHAVLSDATKRNEHIDTIMALVRSNCLAGININYENIASADRRGFMIFIEKLSTLLHAEDRLLHLTLGARTSDTSTGYIYPKNEATIISRIKSIAKTYISPADSVTVSLSPGTGVEAKEYKELIARCADQIILMGYDEWGIPFNHSVNYRTRNYYVSFCSNHWVEQVIKYALTFIPPAKLVLAAPCYGLEFAITHHPTGEISIKKVKSHLYTSAQQMSTTLGIAPQRTPGGELSMCYTHEAGEKRYVVYADHATIKDKINLIKKYGLKGIYFFALYGSEDDRLWSHLRRKR